MPNDDTPAYLQPQNIPGWSGAINNMVRALMAGDAKSANPYFGQSPRVPPSAGPYQPPVTAPQMPPPPPQPQMRGTPMMLPRFGVPYTGQAMGISGPGPMGPLLMQPPRG